MQEGRTLLRLTGASIPGWRTLAYYSAATFREDTTMQRLDPRQIMGAERPIVGMLHLRPLPGAPNHAGMADVIAAACRDAAVLADGGVDAVLIENYGDVPFHPGPVPPETIAAMTRTVAEVRRAIDLPLGINVLRNDALAALGIAAATGGCFIRVNVHTGAMLTDQGWITGLAHETLRARTRLGAQVAILADVLVKHAVPPAGLGIGEAAQDTWQRGLADGLVVSGSATGAAVDPSRLAAVRAAVPAAPLFIGSGLTEQNAQELFALADGAIIGSAFQQAGHAGSPVEIERIRRLLRRLEPLRG